MKRFLLFAAVLMLSIDLLSQQSLKLKDAVYHRSSLTYLLESYRGAYHSQLIEAFKQVGVPEKLDDNRIPNPEIPKITTNRGDVNQVIVNNLQKERIPNQIIANWFNRKADGSFDMNLVLQRGQYNADDKAVLSALAEQRGLSAIDKTAMELVGNSFILVVDIREITSMDEQYDRINKKRRAYAKKNKTPYNPVKAVLNGYQARVNYRLYQINFNDSIAALFYRTLWLDEDDDAVLKEQRKKAFDVFNFPLIYQFQALKKISATQLNPGIPLAPMRQNSKKEMMVRMFENGVEDLLRDIEKVLPKFRVRANLVNSNPIRAKIGLKEGLKVDQRFYVYEDKMNRAGEVKSKRKGVVRVKHTNDNRSNSTGNSKSTEFYQIAGNNLEVGMVLEQYRGANMAISGGYNFMGEVNGVDFRLDYNLSSLFASLSPDGNTTPGFRVFFELGIDYQTYKNNLFKNYDIDNIFKATLNHDADEVYKGNFGFARFGLGLAKSFQLSKNVSLAPELAWNYEIALATDMWDENGEKVALDKIVDKKSLLEPSDISVSENLHYNVHYFIAGAQLIINIAYPFQLYGKLNFFMPFIGTLDRTNNLFTNNNWQDFFNNRTGMSIGGGLRIEF